MRLVFDNQHDRESKRSAIRVRCIEPWRKGRERVTPIPLSCLSFSFLLRTRMTQQLYPDAPHPLGGQIDAPKKSPPSITDKTLGAIAT